jgi:1,4-alpha-glucan branching enzyme
MAQGHLCLFLHAHLPFVRHPENENHLEENWLWEAITETYLPLLGVFERCAAERIPFRLTMSLTPPLVSLLRDGLLQDRYVRHLEKLIELSEKEMERTGTLPDFHELACMYHGILVTARDTFVGVYGKDLVSAFRHFQDLGHLEIVASCATHGFLPNIGVNPGCAQAQILVGIDHYKKTFGREPRGFWLPECGYYKGVDRLLHNAGIGYFFMDSHGIVNAEPRPKYSVYAPIYCPSGVAAFGRDWESSKEVWSATEGYPGDPEYREYYRDIGHELEIDYIKPYIHPEGIRIDTGIKYWRVTGKTGDKEPYRPVRAREKAAEHAEDFLRKRQKQVERLSEMMDRDPLIVAPYDAELFGHWWFEGPQWIDFLIRKIAGGQDVIDLCTPSDYLDKNPVNQLCMPPMSSWGYRGYCEYWLDGSNDWLYRHLHVAGERMKEIAEVFQKTGAVGPSGSLVRRACNQAARELLLAESSDWPFIMKSGTMVPYAQKRVKQHIGRFTKLYEDILAKRIDEPWLAEIERRDTIFADMDCAGYYFRESDAAAQKKVKGVAHSVSTRKPANKPAKKSTGKTKKAGMKKPAKKSKALLAKKAPDRAKGRPGSSRRKKRKQTGRA